MTSFKYMDKVDSLLFVCGCVFWGEMCLNGFFGEILFRWVDLHGMPFPCACSFFGDTENTLIEINTTSLTVVLTIIAWFQRKEI